MYIEDARRAPSNGMTDQQVGYSLQSNIRPKFPGNVDRFQQRVVTVRTNHKHRSLNCAQLRLCVKEFSRASSINGCNNDIFDYRNTGSDHPCDHQQGCAVES